MNKMTKNYGVATVVAALCLVGFVHCVEQLIVEGPVYCDTCRVDFRTPLSYDLKGAKVKLECRNRTTNVVTLSKEAVTDEFGWYKIPVQEDHEDELCEVGLISSPDRQCSDLLEGAVHNARVALTNKNGITQTTRFTSSLGYVTKEPHSNCTRVLLDMGVLPSDFYN